MPLNRSRMIRRDDFPADFTWGTATAAYQIEGAVSEDGRGESIWDRFVRQPGAISDGTTGDVADDYYHRWPEDVAIMSELGVNAYRFSIAWPRIQPTGKGAADEKGITFYSRLIDELLARGITPWVTLYHWDLPQALEDLGGWIVRDTAHRFADYAGLVVDALGDRVEHWITMNEPQVSSFGGYAGGVHAPGARLGNAMAARAAHHLLLGHGLALPRIREAVPGGQAGIALNLWPVYPARDSEADRASARQMHAAHNLLFLQPVLRGEYPKAALEEFGAQDWFDANPAEDLALISAPIDFVGVNYYSRHTVLADAGHGYGEVDSGLPKTAMGWEIYPDGLVEVLHMVEEIKPGTPLYVTENGSAFRDVVDADGAVHDDERLRYLQQHLSVCARATESGLPLQGYFTWTLMDNFEWQYGHSRRFGLVHVDYDTQRRTLKDSGRWFGEFLARR
jgi:beta-glucosidase